QALTHCDGFRTLNSDHASVQRLVLDLYIERALGFLEPTNDLVAVAGIDHHRVAVWPAVNKHVIAYAPLIIANQTVADLHVLHGARVVGIDPLDVAKRVLPAER